MSNEEEKLFPKELREKQLKSTGNQRAWKFKDIPQVVKVCHELGFAILGGQTEFFLPDKTCELYWLQADPTKRVKGESWTQYVDRSCSEFSQLIKKLLDETDFEKLGMEHFDFLKKKKEAGVNFLNYLCFEIYIMSEANYLKNKLKNILHI
jgi:hypothetical protein